MADLIRWILDDILRFIGACILLIIVFGGVEGIVSAFAKVVR